MARLWEKNKTKNCIISLLAHFQIRQQVRQFDFLPQLFTFGMFINLSPFIKSYINKQVWATYNKVIFLEGAHNK